MYDFSGNTKKYISQSTGNKKNFYFCSPDKARVAELVDALVSKTSEVTLVPVRSRPRVQKLLLLSEEAFFCF